MELGGTRGFIISQGTRGNEVKEFYISGGLFERGWVSWYDSWNAARWQFSVHMDQGINGVGVNSIDILGQGKPGRSPPGTGKGGGFHDSHHIIQGRGERSCFCQICSNLILVDYHSLLGLYIPTHGVERREGRGEFFRK